LTYRKHLHEQVFSLIFHGNGGFTWQDVMNMPIWLRAFYIRQINLHFKKQEEANKKQQRKDTRIARPNISPRKRS
tara:strand:+ start:963 stop:1187 length:225 start_codon:yes stop_codon:yes gene_type:complete